MSWYNWLIVILPFSVVIGVACYCRRYIRDVVDYLSCGRLCGRYLIAVAGMEGALGLLTLVASAEVYYKAGFAYGFWGALATPLSVFLGLVGFFSYRFRETRVMTIGELLEKRYSKRFRVLATFLRTFSEMMTNIIGPAVAARFFIYMFGWPSTVNVCGMRMPTFWLVLLISLLCALIIIWVGGQISLTVTDALQGIMCYPIFVIMTLFILAHFSWFNDIIPTLTNRVPGESFLNPYDIKGHRDFNLFAVAVGLLGTVLNRGVWCGGGSDTAAKTPHEGKMAGILGTWRNGFSYLMILLLGVSIITLMNNAKFAKDAHEVRLTLTERIMEDKNYDQDLRKKMVSRMESLPIPTEIPPQSNKVNEDARYFNAAQEVLVAEKGPAAGNAATLEFRSLFNQMMLPVALREMLPEVILALMCLLALLLMVSTDDSRIFSSARTLAQDVVMPFIKKPLTVKQQLWLIRGLTLFVCIFFFVGSVFLSQLDYINLYCTIMSSIWIGGAGCVTMGALYTRFGTTAGAYASLIFGAGVSTGGVLIQRNWPDHVYPFLERMGWVEPVGNFLSAVSKPFNPYILWEMNPVKFPINSTEISFLAMIFSIIAYVSISLLTCRKPFNLDKLLHRGEYNVEHTASPKIVWNRKTFITNFIGITPEYTKGDKIIAWSVFGYSIVYGFCIMFAGVVFWNFIQPWPEHWWGYKFFITTLAVPVLIGIVSTIWFMWGGIRDLGRLFHDLALRKATPEDNGMIRDTDKEEPPEAEKRSK